MRITDQDFKQSVTKLRSILKGWESNPVPIIQETIEAREEVIGRFQPLFSAENVKSITQDDFRDFLLASNNKHWRGLHRHWRSITQDLELLREALFILVDENRSIEERMQILLPKSGAMVKRLGRAILTPILLVTYPEKYGVLNTPAKEGMQLVGLWPNFDRGENFSQRYAAVNEILVKTAEALEIDLWTLDTLWWEVIDRYRPQDADQQLTETEEFLEDRDLGFGLERHLHDFLFDNWEKIGAFNDWTLYEEDGDIVGYEYITDVGKIDLLAYHKTEPKWLVIELKRDYSSDKTVGQILRYMGFIKREMSPNNESVEGLIISRITDDKLRYALEFASNVSFLLYEVNFTLREPNE